MASKGDFISRARQTVSGMLESFYSEWSDLWAQYQALGYADALTDGDFSGDNGDLTAAQFKAAVAAVNNVKGALDGNSSGIWPLRK